MYIEKSRPRWNPNSLLAVLFVFSLLGFEYYAFIILFNGRLLEIVSLPLLLYNLQSKGLSIFIIVETNIFVFLLLWSYFKVIFTGPGYLSKNINEYFSDSHMVKTRIQRIARYKFGASRTDKNSNIGDQPVENKNNEGEAAELNIEEEKKLKEIAEDPILQMTILGYCFKCNAVKIPRSHHCRQCERCVVRMDHHCPWVANCVGAGNHKFFILFLIYAMILLLQIILWESFYYLLDADNFKEVSSFLYYVFINCKTLSVGTQLLLTANLGSCIAIFLAVCFLGGFQIYIATKNITTVEFHVKNIMQRNPFDKGVSKNLESLFGTRRLEWFLPVDPKLPAQENHHLLQEFSTVGQSEGIHL